MEEDYYDEEYWENQPCDDCLKCGRHYNDIDYDYQSCSKCGWDEEKQEYGDITEPSEEDYLSSDADILTGRWY